MQNIPTVGRVVNVHLPGVDRMVCAFVTAVWTDTMINVRLFPADIDYEAVMNAPQVGETDDGFHIRSLAYVHPDKIDWQGKQSSWHWPRPQDNDGGKSQSGDSAAEAEARAEDAEANPKRPESEKSE